MELKLDSKTILEKEFKSGMRGYKQEDVDLFLDDVIQDYETFKKEIARLKEENEKLKAAASAAPQRTAAPTPQPTNFDILQRISNLERHVFGSKLSDD
ncbi:MULTISPECIES: cell division regulator GpsB [Sporosarcina]|uniref:cell division regulator GpsB n=1 Tax=Sporosarcina TaxID=1569 RepID=UPI00129ACEAD|nr:MULTISPECIES: cell division regulator GpsB [Sporosarcina]GKV67156.1 cell cycle protein GpsB [Sporosarcina sp. NCCP-2331]GLB57504.1 cell cycle protein GpsB [Sporosarcina sp. NCCP-2378]